MREILFRAFVKDKQKIYAVKKIDFDYGMVWFEEENKPTDTMRMFDQIELMQFTGLTDKNGKKIFEGDIVKGLFSYSFPVNSVVKFQDGTFGLEWYRGDIPMFWGFTNICNVEYEVIGNVHDQDIGEQT